MEIYQLFSTLTGGRLETIIAESAYEAIEQWIKKFWMQEGQEFHVNEAEKWLERWGIGLDFEHLACREYTPEEYAMENKIDLELAVFKVWKATKHRGSYHREFVCSNFLLMNPVDRRDSIIEDYNEDCLGYLDELVRVGEDSTIYEFLSKHQAVDDLMVTTCITGIAFHPIPANKWLAWYRFAKAEIKEVTTEDTGLSGDYYYDEHGRFVDYPFPGISLIPDHIKYIKKIQSLKEHIIL